MQSAERCMTALTTLRHGSCGFSKSASGAKSGRRGAGVSKEGRPCSDCGAIYHPAAMHWDHRPGTAKVTEVSHLVRRASRGAALKEIRKCDLVCANCHAVRTYERQRGVAQPGRAPALGAGGRRFRSGRPDCLVPTGPATPGRRASRHRRQQADTTGDRAYGGAWCRSGNLQRRGGRFSRRDPRTRGPRRRRRQAGPDLGRHGRDCRCRRAPATGRHPRPPTRRGHRVQQLRGEPDQRRASVHERTIRRPVPAGLLVSRRAVRPLSRSAHRRQPIVPPRRATEAATPRSMPGPC